MMTEDQDTTANVPDVTKPHFQFDIRAIMAVTATVAVVLASVGRERAPELLIAACVIAVVALIEYWLVHRLRPFVAGWQATDITQRIAWMLLGALGGYIVLVSTDAYSDPRHRIIWSFACGIAAMCGAMSMQAGTSKRALFGAVAVMAVVGPAFLLDVFIQRAGSSLVASGWETACAALAGAAVVLAVSTLRQLETRWSLPRYAIPCVWLVAASVFAELCARFITGW